MKDKTLKQLVESIKASSQPKTSAYDTSATVTRVENGTAWVHIPGGVTETPVKLTINAKAGDTVQVRVSGGRAFMVGNATAPPTDNTVANKALGETKTITKVVKAVQNLAEKTARIAGNTNQYFWHTSTGTDTGAHITEIPQEDFLADPTNGGGNLLARSNGIAVRDGLTELARFSADGVQIGQENANRLSMTSVGLVGISDSGIETFNIKNSGYNGSSRIAEASGAIINTGRLQYQFLAYTYTPNATPVDLTNIRHELTFSLTYQDESTDVKMLYDYLYDESDDTSEVKNNTLMPYGDSAPGITIRVRYYYNSKSIELLSAATGNAVSIDSVQFLTRMTAINPILPSYTFGLRSGTTTDEGAYSFVNGELNIASGEASVAFGVENEVSGMGASAHGASNFVSSNYGFATGQSNSVSGQNATALGFNLLASSSSQTVIGRYNVADTNDEYAFIIGNGDVSDRHNLLTMGWNGETRLYGQYSYFFSDDNAEHQVRFTNQAHIDGLTYADDGVYPHSCDFYGCSGASPIALGAWDLRNAHHIWRYDDQDQFLELYQNIRVNNRRVDFPQLLGSTASGSFTLPVTKGCYLIVTGHNSTAGANSIWIARMGSNNMFKLAGGSNITITASGNNTITVTSSGGSVNVSYIFLGYNN